MHVPQLGIGLQLNPMLLGWFPFFKQSIDALEILFDSVMAPIDGPDSLTPTTVQLLTDAAAAFQLVGHSNYGGDFGFNALESTATVRRHIPLARELKVPWVSNHCFYSDDSWSDVWCSPLQFSDQEISRLADRARKLQDLYGVPLAHENAAYYRTCPGSMMPEEEFLARLVERSGTFLHLDLHNLYANFLNHREQGYSISRFLDVIPLDRVICIHMAGGRWLDKQYHDLHDTPVPEDVWDLLDEALSLTKPGAVIFEYETDALRNGQGVLDKRQSIDLIMADLARGRSAWERAFGVSVRRQQ